MAALRMHFHSVSAPVQCRDALKHSCCLESSSLASSTFLISDLTTLYRTAYNAHAFTTETWLMCVWRVIKRAKSEMTNELMIASITSGFVLSMTLCYFLWNRRGFSLKFRPATIHHSPYSKQTCTAVGFYSWVLLMRLVWSVLCRVSSSETSVKPWSWWWCHYI